MVVNLAIFGNCQAEYLRLIFSFASPGINLIETPLSFACEISQMELWQRLKGADIVLAQRTVASKETPWATSAWIKDRFGDRVIIWPVLYFDGYFPGVRYYRIPGLGSVPSALDGYHFQQIIDGHAQGLTVEATAERLQSARTTEHPFFQSLKQLRQREADCDMPFSELIRSGMRREKLFATPNHPNKVFMLSVASQVAATLGFPFDGPAAAAQVGEISQVSIPVLSWVQSRYKLGWCSDATFSGIELERDDSSLYRKGGFRTYSTVSLVEKFFEVYDAVLEKTRRGTERSTEADGAMRAEIDLR